ncbi:MAG: thiamine phosphate synthase [Solirubrobacteraceae bacterium]
MNDLRQSLSAAALYLVCDAVDDELLDAALRGGVGIVQLRVKTGSDAEIMAASRRFAAACHAHGALLLINDRPDLAVATGADGVHIGQDDMPVGRARRVVGAERLVGLSTHTPAQVDAACAADVDYIGVGPVHATPTKPGRAPVGLELIRHAAAHATVPFFAIGGIDAGNAGAVAAAGARRIAVVRALTEAADAQAAARALLAAIGAAAQEAGVGPA